MAVEIDKRGLIGASRQRSTICVLLRPPSGGTATSTSDLARGVAAADAAHEIDGEPGAVWASDFWQGPHGPVVLVADAGGANAFAAWLESLASALTASGVSGRLTVERGASPETAEHPVAALVAVLHVRDWDIDPRDRRTISPWRRKAPLAADLVSRMVRWVATHDWPLYCSIAFGSYSVGVDQAVALTLREPDTAAVVASPGRGRLRRAMFDPSGRLVLHCADGEGWEQDLASLRQVVLDEAGVCEYAYVRRSWSNVLNAVDVVSVLPPVMPARNEQGMYHYLRFLRHLDDQQVPDAFGLQLLAESHLARAPALRSTDRWRSTSLDSGLTLVEAADPEAWFSLEPLDERRPDPRLPAPETLAAARLDFGEVVFAAAPPWESIPDRR